MRPLTTLPDPGSRVVVSENVMRRVDTLGNCNGAIDTAYVTNIDALFTTDEKFWSRVALGLKTDWRKFDVLIRRLHYKRSHPWECEQRRFIARFLTMGYIFSRDVRYLNEFLFFVGEDPENYWDVNRAIFLDALDASGHHKHPTATRDDVDRAIVRTRDASASAPRRPEPLKLRVGMLGTPSGYVRLYEKALAHGHMPMIYFFSHDSSTLKRWVKSTRWLTRLIFQAKGCAIPYTTITDDVRSESVAAMLAADKLDIGFQRVGFIVKNNLIRNFRIGLLNGHLAILPFVRGKSSIEFSVLAGFPVGGTVHFVDEGVDTGEIVLIFPYSYHDFGARTVAELKDAISSRGDEWFIEALEYVARTDVPRLPNPGEMGLQYYTMHQSLVDYIERNLLKQGA